MSNLEQLITTIETNLNPMIILLGISSEDSERKFRISKNKILTSSQPSSSPVLNNWKLREIVWLRKPSDSDWRSRKNKTRKFPSKSRVFTI